MNDSRRLLWYGILPDCKTFSLMLGRETQEKHHECVSEMKKKKKKKLSLFWNSQDCYASPSLLSLASLKVATKKLLLSEIERLKDSNWTMLLPECEIATRRILAQAMFSIRRDLLSLLMDLSGLKNSYFIGIFTIFASQQDLLLEFIRDPNPVEPKNSIPFCRFGFDSRLISRTFRAVEWVPIDDFGLPLGQPDQIRILN